MTARETLLAAINSLGITVRADFVPWSESRNKGEPDPSLNWRVTIVRNGRDVLTADYGAGLAHCPSYKQNDRSDVQRRVIAWECERGQRGSYSASRHCVVPAELAIHRPILPDICDVVYSLISDSDVINYAKFEDWAIDSGYSTDSRSAEVTYRMCLETSLALRNGVGEDGLRVLSEACRDY